MRPWGIRRLFRQPTRTREDVTAEVAEELACHLEMRAEELMRTGMNPRDAHVQARREYGRVDLSAAALARMDGQVEQRRRARRFMAEIWQDARTGLRLLARGPGFTVVAVLTLALGIGANTAIYSVLDAILLRPLPYPDPDRIMMVSETRDGGIPNSSSGGAFLDWRAHQTRFDALVLTGRIAANLRGTGAPDRLIGMEVSHELLDVLGIQPLLGRGFLPDEDRPGGNNHVVILTESLWRSRFASDASILDRTIILDEVPRRVIGVLPRGGWMLKEDSFFIPAVLTPGTERASRSGHWAAIFGRLAPEATPAQADAELKQIKQQLNAQYPGFKQVWSVAVQPVTDVLGGVTRTPLLILLGAVSLVLLIACANVANLLLARGCHRQAELAVRAALGASGARLVRQVLTENLMLALLGGLTGIGVAFVGVDVLRGLTSSSMPIAFEPQLNLQVLLFSLAITVATGPLVGLLPALRARTPDLRTTISSGSKGTAGGGRQRTQSALIVAEVALTVVLLASAGLLLRSLARTISTDPGFEPARILTFDVSLPDAAYQSADTRLAFANELLVRLRGIAGVEGAGTAMAIPFIGGGYGEFFNRPDGQVSPVIGRIDFVSPGYLEALGTRLLAGRSLAEADNRRGGPRVAVISESTMKMFFPARDAVGQPLRVRGQVWEVVGVVADVVDRRLDVPHGPFAYVPSAFNPSRFAVVVRTPLEPLGLVETMRGEVASLDPGVALANPQSLDQAMAESMVQRKLVLALVGTFAATALLLAAIGLYGVMAYAVATRRREFGIRMAFGAVRSDLVHQVLRGGLGLTTAGLMLGLTGAIAASHLLASELYQVRGTDPAVLAGTATTVLAVAALACWIPAWRASRLDPTAALRAD
jgi:predicted permease